MREPVDGKGVADAEGAGCVTPLVHYGWLSLIKQAQFPPVHGNVDYHIQRALPTWYRDALACQYQNDTMIAHQKSSLEISWY